MQFTDKACKFLAKSTGVAVERRWYIPLKQNRGRDSSPSTPFSAENIVRLAFNKLSVTKMILGRSTKCKHRISHYLRRDFKAFILFPAMTKSAMMQDLLNTYLLRHCQEKIAERLATVKIVKRFVLCSVLPKARFGKLEKGYAPGSLCDGTFHKIPCFETLHRVCWMFLPRYLCNQQSIWKRFLQSVNSTN